MLNHRNEYKLLFNIHRYTFNFSWLYASNIVTRVGIIDVLGRVYTGERAPHVTDRECVAFFTVFWTSAVKIKLAELE